MQKQTIEIERRDKHISGYGTYKLPTPDSSEILDKLIEWSKENNYKIYKHKIRYEEENIGKDGVYEFRNELCPSQNIPYCDLVSYLDIYYQ